MFIINEINCLLKIFHIFFNMVIQNLGHLKIIKCFNCECFNELIYKIGVLGKSVFSGEAFTHL